MKPLLIVLVVLVLAAGLFFMLGPSKKVRLPGRPAAEAAVEVGEIDSKKVAESSGIVESRRFPGVFWTHNDKGNAAVIYAIERDGEMVGEFKVDAKNDDWEDIAADDEGRLYIARTGNNDAKKKEVSVLRVEEPDPRGEGKGKVGIERTWRLRYPGKAFDAESLFVFQRHGYVISKLFNGKPAGVYRFPLEEGEGPHELERVTEIPVTSPVTSADVSRDGKRMAVLVEGGLVVFAIEGEVKRAGGVEAVHFRLPGLQFEGCCFTEGGVLVTAESREIYFCPVGS
jgi:hypothetical protein